MNTFEQDVLEKLGTIGERLARLETQMLGLPCLTDCPRPKDGNLKKNGNGARRWLYMGMGIGVGLTGAGGIGAAIVKVLGV